VKLSGQFSRRLLHQLPRRKVNSSNDFDNGSSNSEKSFFEDEVKTKTTTLAALKVLPKMSDENDTSENESDECNESDNSDTNEVTFWLFCIIKCFFLERTT